MLGRGGVARGGAGLECGAGVWWFWVQLNATSWCWLPRGTAGLDEEGRGEVSRVAVGI